jgi:uncharacterized BrkB/YihY/UPF0761 family membrane protein
MNLLKKIRKIKKSKRKVIFWVIVILAIILFGSLFFVNAKKKIEAFEGKNFLEEIGLRELENLFNNDVLPANIENIIKEQE